MLSRTPTDGALRRDQVAAPRSEDFEALVASVPEYAIFLLDPHGVIESWNIGAERIKGWRPSEIIGRHFSSFYTPEDLAVGRPVYLLETAAQRGVAHDEGWRMRKDGSRFWADVTLTALRRPDGSLRGFAKVTRDQTDKRQAIEALRESEERFRLLVAGVKDYAIFMLEPDGRVASWNRGAEVINGYTAEEIIGHHFGRFYPPEDLARGKPQLELEIAAEKGEYSEEGWRLRKDGGRFWASVVITAVRDESGKLRGFAKVTRDLTERRRVEEALLAEQTSRARADALARRAGMLAELGQALIGPLDPNETLRRLARVVTHHLGDYCLVDLRAADGSLRRLAAAHVDPAQEPALLEMRRLYPPERQPGHRAMTVLRSGVSDLVPQLTDDLLVSSAIDAEHLARLRALHAVSNMIVPLRAGNEIVGTLTIVSTQAGRRYDPTDVVLAEDVAARAALAISNAELFEREQQARAAAETLARAGAVLSSTLDYQATLEGFAAVLCPALCDWAVVAMLQPDGTLVNAAVGHADPARASWARELVSRHPYDPMATIGPSLVLRTGKPELHTSVSDEILVSAGRGAEHLAAMRSLGMTSAICVPLSVHGRILGTLSLVRVGERPRFDEWHLDLAQELARRAALAAENARLYSDAQAAIRVRDDFIGIASHELRTPLAALQLHVQAMIRTARKHAAPEGQLDRLQGAMTQITRQTRMIEQLLDFSRLVAGRVEMVPEELDLAVLVRELVERFSADAAQSRVALTTHVPPTLVGRWDRNTLEQIMSNLVSNAIKYGREHPVEIIAEQRLDRAFITVRDHGIGIAAEDQARIFGRFERAVSSRNYGGFGLGLWIAQRGAEHLGGRISVTSEPGQGAAFTLELPLAGRTS